VKSTHEDHQNDREGTSLNEEFLELSEAAAVAYIALTNTSKTFETDQRLADARHLVAIALSTVAPIYMATRCGARVFVLGPEEVERLLFRPLRERATPALKDLRIRRHDLRAAITTLKEARQAFMDSQSTH
jgi:hypothetical protein